MQPNRRTTASAIPGDLLGGISKGCSGAIPNQTNPDVPEKSDHFWLQKLTERQ
jgi:hypothetical protein